MKNTFIVVGGAGFIGSHLVDALLSDISTFQVKVIDDFSSGRIEHLQHHGANIADGRLIIVQRDLLDESVDWSPIFEGADTVFNLAANPDARKGITDTMLDLRLETILTRNVLEAMRISGCKKIIFSSSGTVYGDAGLTACKEGQGERLPISLYGAGKVASEALISAFCGTFGMSAILLRFGNVVGERATHGCIKDFLEQLLTDHTNLNVLGDGRQSKPYLYVKEVVAGMMHTLKIIGSWNPGLIEPYNLAPEGATTVGFIAEELIRQMGLKSKIKYGEGAQGWAGDVPNSRMDMSKLEATGFKLERSSDEAVKYAIEQILKSL